MTDREKILIALREKPLKAFEIMKRVNIKHQDDCQSLLLKMRDDGAVKFDIHKGHWRAAWQRSLGHQRLVELLPSSAEGMTSRLWGGFSFRGISWVTSVGHFSEMALVLRDVCSQG
jgi:hypothetical protein